MITITESEGGDFLKARKLLERAGINGYAMALCAMYIISRVVVLVVGIRFDSTPITWYWQYLDPNLLQTDLLRSLWFLHSQPPLFNMFLGFVLKVFGSGFTVGFHIFYILFGLSVCVCFYLLLREFRVKPYAAAVIVFLFMASPSTISYENWLFYTYPVMALLCLTALLGVKLARTGRLKHAVWFLTLVMVVVLTRSLFHPVFYALCAGLAVFLSARETKTKTLFAALLVAIPILAVMIKNLILFGFFGTSSWYGLNLARATTFMLPDREREALVDQGHLSEHGLTWPFAELWRRADWLERTEIPEFGAAATDSMTTSTGENNHNHAAYIILSREYFQDALTVVRLRPSILVKSSLHAYSHYFVPSSCYALVEEHIFRMGAYARFYEALFQGSAVMLTRLELALADDSGNMAAVILSMNLYMLLLLPISIVFWLWRIIRNGRNPRTGVSVENTQVLPLLLIFFFATLVGNLVEVGENNRFRFMIDPIIITLIVVSLAHLWKKLGNALLSGHETVSKM